MPTKPHAGSHDAPTATSHLKEDKPETAEDYAKRVDKLVEAVKEAFTQNHFSTPGDIEVQIRGMAALSPHPAAPPEAAHH